MTVRQLLERGGSHHVTTDLACCISEELSGGSFSDIYVRDECVAGYQIPHVKLTEIPTEKDGDILIYHFSGAWPEAAAFIAGRTENVVLVVHENLKSALSMESNVDLVEELTVLGLAATQTITMSGSMALELALRGITNVEVACRGSNPLRLSDEPTDLVFGSNVNKLFPDGFILCVADMVQESKIETAVEAVHLLRVVQRREVGLVVLSGYEDTTYRKQIDSLVSRYSDVNTLFLGPVSEAGLATLYRNARLFLDIGMSASSPVRSWEAMAEGCPVVLRTSERFDSPHDLFAFILPASEGPVVVAEAMDRVLIDSTLRSTLVQVGREHARTLASGLVGPTVSSLIGRLIA